MRCASAFRAGSVLRVGKSPPFLVKARLGAGAGGTDGGAGGAASCAAWRWGLGWSTRRKCEEPRFADSCTWGKASVNFVWLQISF